MTKVFSSSIESFCVKLYGGTREIKSGKLSDCADYVVVIDELSMVLVVCLSTGRGWRVPVKGRALSIAINHGYEFAVLSENGTVQRFDLTLPTICIGSFRAPSSCSISYDHTGTMLVVAHANGTVGICDLEVRPDPTLVALFRVTNRAIPLLSARQDSVLGVDVRGRLFCLRSPEAEPQLYWNGAEHLDLDCYAMALHPYLNRVAVAGFGSYVRYYSAPNVPPVTLLTSFKFVRELVFLLDVNQLAVIGDSGLEVWNLDTNTVELEWQTPSTGKVICAKPSGTNLRLIWNPWIAENSQSLAS